MSRKLCMYARLLMFSLVGIISTFPAIATFTPVSLPVSGPNSFNADVIANGIGIPSTSTSHAFDIAGYVLLDQTYRQTTTSAAPNYYLPANGTLNSAYTNGLTFQLAPASGNNSLRLTGTASGTLQFPASSSYIGDVYILGASGNGSATATVTIHFVGGSTQVATGLNFPDWFNGSPTTVQAIGRVGLGSPYPQDGTTSNPRLYEQKVTLQLANYGKQIERITITKTTSSAVLNIMAITVDHQTCIPPLNLSANSVTTIGANFNWNAVSGASGYEYALTTSPTPPSSGTFQTSNSYNASSLNPGTNYYFHVRTSCSGNTHSIWNTLPISTLPCPSPGNPIIDSVKPGTVWFSWPGTSIPGVLQYQYAVVPTATLPVTWTATSNTTAMVGGLIPGNTYHLYVRSNCVSSVSASNPLPFVNPFPTCYEPGFMTIQNINITGADISWPASITVPPAIGYEINISTSSIPPTSGTAVSTTSFAATGLAPATTYFVQLRTHCGTTNFSPWIIDSFKTPASCLPPTQVTLGTPTTTSVSINWSSYPGIDGFEYVIDNSPQDPAASGVLCTYNALSAAGLYTGTAYYFHIRTKCDPQHFSGWSTYPFTTQSVCGNIPNPALLFASAQTASFSWPGVPEAENYEYGVSSTLQPPAMAFYTNTTQATVNNLIPGTSYYFYVRALCSSSDSSGWATHAFSTQSTSIRTQTGSGETPVRIYPNPVENILIIEVSELTEDAVLILLNVSGTALRQVELNEKRTILPMTDLPSGTYFLRYIAPEKTAVIPLLKK